MHPRVAAPRLRAHGGLVCAGHDWGKDPRTLTDTGHRGRGWVPHSPGRGTGHGGGGGGGTATGDTPTPSHFTTTFEEEEGRGGS